MARIVKLTIILFALCAVLPVVVLLSSAYASGGIADESVHPPGSLMRYDYFDWQADDSTVFVQIYPIGVHEYAYVTTYRDGMNAYWKQSGRLADDDAERFETYLESIKTTNTDEPGEQRYGYAVVYADSGSQALYVPAFDMDQYDIADPRAENVDTIVSKPEYVNIFSDIDMKQLTEKHVSCDSEYYAFLQMVRDQVITIAGTDKIRDIIVNLSDEADGKYALKVEMPGGIVYTGVIYDFGYLYFN